MSFNEFYKKEIKEKESSIRRFAGSNELDDIELLTFLHKLQGAAKDGNIDLSIDDTISMSEKFDGIVANWGLTDTFFIETKKAEITSNIVDNSPPDKTTEVFNFLESYQPFQERLKKAHEYAGEDIKYISEMFPVLSHESDNLGNVVFSSVKYNKDKFGAKGAFMVYDVKVKDGESWINPSDDIKNMLIEIVRSLDDPEWKVFYADQDGKLSGSIQLDFSGIKDFISSPEKLAASIAILNNKNDPQREQLKSLITKLRPILQKQLDTYTEKASSKFSKDGEQSPIGNALMRVTLPTGIMFVKGTSPAMTAYEQQNVDELAGGLAQGKTLEQIAAKHGLTVEDIKNEFLAGMEHEMEHTNDHEIAGEIAKDHLWEDPYYYSHLTKAGIDELDVSNMLSKIKARMAGKPKVKELPPGYYKDPTLDDLQAEPYIPPTDSAKNDWDDNLKDQDDGIDPSKELWNRAVKYISTGGLDDDPEEWDEQAEMFDEDEVLDERKFEKVKMARNVLSRLGYPKAYQRDNNGKYIFRSKHIRKLMKKLGYQFSDEKGRWIAQDIAPEKGNPETSSTTPTPIISEPKPEKSADAAETEQKKAIICVGHARPWHKGHDRLVTEASNHVKEIGANIVFIMIVKEKAEDTPQAPPMDFAQQIKLVETIYNNIDGVDISSIPVPTESIVDVMAVAARQNVIIKGWIVEDDKAEEIKNQYHVFKTDKYKGDFEQKTKPGTPYPIEGDVQIISANNKQNEVKENDQANKAAASQQPIIPANQMTDELARNLVHKLDFNHWFKEVCAQKFLHIDSVKSGYNEAYSILSGENKQNIFESLRRNLTDLFGD